MFRELTEVEELQSSFSDLYKDVHGVRPRWCSAEQFNSAEWLNAQISSLCIEMDSVIAIEAEQEHAAISRFEKRVVEIIAMGAGDRETALRWIFDAEE